jgi:hypothetical protein
MFGLGVAAAFEPGVEGDIPLSEPEPEPEQRPVAAVYNADMPVHPAYSYMDLGGHRLDQRAFLLVAAQ